jgi:hypothetical protein
MFNLKRHSLLFLMVFLILLIVPMSFATDVNDTADIAVEQSVVNDVDIVENDLEVETPVESASSNQVLSAQNDDVLSSDYDYETYISDPESAVVDYTPGDSDVQISVKTTYDYSTMKELGNSKMYAFINGDSNGIVVKSTWNFDVQGSAASFVFKLNQFDAYLTQPTNTIVFHPD